MLQLSRRRSIVRGSPFVAIVLALIAAVGACGDDGEAPGAPADASQEPSIDRGAGENGGPIAHGPMGSATETNVAPIRCVVPSDCPEGRTCVRENPNDEAGSCLRADAGSERGDEDGGR